MVTRPYWPQNEKGKAAFYQGYRSLTPFLDPSPVNGFTTSLERNQSALSGMRLYEY